MTVEPFVWDVVPTILIQVITQLKLEIQQSHQECNQFLQVFDSDQELRPFSNEYETYLTLPLLKNANSSNEIPLFQVPKYSRICSIVHLDVSSISFAAPSSEEEPLFQLPSFNLHGSHDRTFYVISIAKTQKTEDSVTDIGKSMRKISNGIIIATFNDSVSIWRPSSNGQRLEYLAKLLDGESQRFQLLSHKVDYNGSPLILTTCPICGNSVKYFEKTGDWIVFFEAIIYELFTFANATLEFQTVAALPLLEKDEEGDWDSWVSPLTDGTAAVAAFQPYSSSRLQEFFYPQPLVFDRVTFLTGKPKRIHEAVTLSRLLSPLSVGLWMGILGAVVALFFAIEMAIRLHWRWSSEAEDPMMELLRNMAPRFIHDKNAQHSLGFTLAEIIKPSVGQAGNANFEKTIERNDQVKFLFGVWLLALIVIGSAYQSEMTSHIVSPAFSKPPRTFRDLAYSDYNSFAVFWDLIEQDFQFVETDYSDAILEAVKELQYFEPDCYVKIFQGDNVCIGFDGVMMNLAVEFLMDTKGRLMYLKAKEGLFVRPLSYAVSNYHKNLQDRLEYLIRSVLASGLNDHYTWNLLIYNTAKGMKFAETKKEMMRIYGGEEADDEDDSIVPLLARVGMLGLGLSFGVFLYEVVCKFVIEKVFTAEQRKKRSSLSEILLTFT